LIIEGMAQTGGLLVGEVGGFEERVVLAKVSKAEFAFPVFPGDTLRYVAEIQRLQPDGAIVQGTVHVGDRQQASIELMFAHLDDQNFQGVEQFEPSDMLRWMRLLGLYDVGKDEKGERLQPPPRMLEAERRVLARSG
jgi:3-hydroxyacyl-[acyl-carrier-protein] dehydratase